MRERIINGLQLKPKVPEFSYCRISDPYLRVQLRVGELIATAAIIRGISFDEQLTNKGDEWARCTPKRIMDVLTERLDQHSITEILKAAKRIGHASDVNGDNQAIAQEIHRLIRKVGRPKIDPPEIPSIPGKSS